MQTELLDLQGPRVQLDLQDLLEPQGLPDRRELQVLLDLRDLLVQMVQPPES